MKKRIFTFFALGFVAVVGFGRPVSASVGGGPTDPYPPQCLYNTQLTVNGVPAGSYGTLNIQRGDSLAGGAQVGGYFIPGVDDEGNDIFPNGPTSLTVTETLKSGGASHYLASETSASPISVAGTGPILFSSNPIMDSIIITATFKDPCGVSTQSVMEVNLPVIRPVINFSAGFSYPSMSGGAIEPSNGDYTSPNIAIGAWVSSAQEYCDPTGSQRWNQGVTNPHYVIKNSLGTVVAQGNLPIDTTYFEPASSGTCGPANTWPTLTSFGKEINFTSQAPGTYSITLTATSTGCKDPNWCNINPLPVTGFFKWRAYYANPAGGGGLSNITITPDPSNYEQLTIAGTGSGGIYSTGGGKCPDDENVASGAAVIVTPTKLSGPTTYKIDNGPSLPFVLSQTQAGQGFTACLSGQMKLLMYLYSFNFPVDGSTLSRGLHIITLTVHDVFTNQDVSFPKYFMVGVPPPGGAALGGAINVTSRNAVVSTDPVVSSWVITGPTDVCSGYCYGSQKTIQGVPLGTYSLPPTSVTAPDKHYALRSVERAPIAEQKTWFEKLFSSLDGLISKAMAKVVCGFLNSAPSSCPVPMTTIPLGADGDTANYIILWDPIGTIDVSPVNTLLTSSKLSDQISIQNLNGAPGSKVTNLKWLVSYGGGATGWLTTSSLAGVELDQGGAAKIATLTAAVPAGGCPSGCNANVQIWGTSGGGGDVYSSTFTVTLVPAVTPIQIIPNPPEPTPIGVPVPMSCTGGTGSYNWTATGLATPASGSGSNFQTTYMTTGTFSAKCTDSSGESSTVPLVIVPDCTITASPTRIVPPGQSTLNWSCIPNTVQSCILSGPGVSNVSVGDTGTRSVSPTTGPAQYRLTCVASNGTGVTLPPATTTITIGKVPVIEGNP